MNCSKNETADSVPTQNIKIDETVEIETPAEEVTKSEEGFKLDNPDNPEPKSIIEEQVKPDSPKHENPEEPIGEINIVSFRSIKTVLTN